MKKFNHLLLSASLLSILSLASISAEVIADRSGYGHNPDNIYRGSNQNQNYRESYQNQNYGNPYRNAYRYDNNATNYGGYYGGAPYYGGNVYSGAPVVPGYGYPAGGGYMYTPFPDSARSDAIYRSNQQLPR